VCITTDYVRVGHGRGRSAVYVYSSTLAAAAAAAAAVDNAIIAVDADPDAADATVVGEKRALPLQGLSVEDVALQHYKALGYSGVHSEWRVPQLLTGLLLHDVIWDSSSVPAAFIHKLQAGPLDLHSSDFARRRATALCQRLSVIASYTREQLEADVANRWDSVQPYYTGVALLCTHMRTYCKADVVALAAALGGARLSALLQLFVSDISAYSWGVPDLLVWRSNGEVQFVEVKGKDQLLAGQQFWLPKLRAMGIGAVVCRVQARDAQRINAHIMYRHHCSFTKMAR
jgi:VRR-NUC domain